MNNPDSCENLEDSISPAASNAIVLSHCAPMMNDNLLAPAIPFDVIAIGPCFSAHPVSFSLLTTDLMQFVGFYDHTGQLTVASRMLDSLEWTKITLDERVGWDSHNGIALGRDCMGGLHLSGNMHAAPLVYFRSTRPDDIHSFERVSVMVGTLENEVTYPQFFYGPEEDLYFGYRHGSSGKGDQIYNHYLASEQRWERLPVKPIASGEGIRNAYLDGPVYGPDGFFHLCWVWRDDPDCSTNHDVCYARSRDFIHWETSGGIPLELPITVANAEIIDPVPVCAGLFNGNVRIGFDAGLRLVITYHKLDPTGNTQIYNARLESEGWKVYQTSDWTGAWLPAGYGTVEAVIRVYPLRADPSRRLLLPYSHRDHGVGVWILDDETLRPVATLPGLTRQLPEEFAAVGTGMKRHWLLGARPSGNEGGPEFALTWESLPENRDKPQARVPSPSCLKLVRFENASEVFVDTRI